MRARRAARPAVGPTLAILDTSQPAADSGAAGGRRGYMQHSQEFALQSQFSQTSVTLQCTNLSQWN